MTTNTFDTEESNSSISSPQYYVDDDGSLKFISPVLSSSNFDGSVPVFEGQIVASDLSPGKFIKIGEEYFPVLSVSYDDPELEEDPSEEITATYLDSNSEVQSITYNLFDDVDVKYENWEEKYLGTQGWSLTYGGNAIFTNVAVRGDLEASTLDVGGPGGITYDGTEVVIGASVTILGGLTIGDVTDYLNENNYATDDDLTDFITGPQLQDNTTIISGGNIQTGTISAITFQTNLSGRRSKLGVGDGYIPSNWTTTIVARTGGGSTSYIPTGLEFYDQNGARTGYFYSLDKYTSGTFQSGSRLFVFGTTDSSGLDTGTEILLSNLDIDLYAAGQIDIRSSNGVRLYGSNDTGINVGSFGSDQVYIDGQKINFSQGWSPTYGPSPSAQFYSHIYAMSGYKFFGDGSGLTNIPAPANAVLTTGTYANPSWITSLAGSKISGNISGNSNNITQYTVNQNVGTGNSVTFSGITNANNQITSLPTYNNANSGLTVNQHITSAGVFRRVGSTQRIKTNIKILNHGTLSNNIDKNKIINSEPVFNYKDILLLTPVEYNPLEGGEVQENIISIGFIAEDVADKVPLLATYDEEGIPEYYNVNGIVSSILAVVQDQQKTIDDLEYRVLQLESQLGG